MLYDLIDGVVNPTHPAIVIVRKELHSPTFVGKRRSQPALVVLRLDKSLSNVFRSRYAVIGIIAIFEE